LKADVTREKMAAAAALAAAKAPVPPKAMVAARPKVETPKKVESPELVAARLEVAALLKQARAADQHGHFDRAMEFARAADDLASARGLHLNPNENRPEDMLQRLREKKFAAESGSRLAALRKASPEISNTVEVAQEEAGRVQVVADDMGHDVRGGTVRHANEFERNWRTSSRRECRRYSGSKFPARNRLSRNVRVRMPCGMRRRMWAVTHSRTPWRDCFPGRLAAGGD
jgi:hypothetical protein